MGKGLERILLAVPVLENFWIKWQLKNEKGTTPEEKENNTTKDTLEDNSDKALVTVVHCNDDIKNIDEEKAPSKIGITAPPQVRIKQLDVYTEKVKIAESTSNLNSTITSEAESAHKSDDTGSVLAVIKNSSDSDIIIT